MEAEKIKELMPVAKAVASEIIDVTRKKLELRGLSEQETVAAFILVMELVYLAISEAEINDN